MNNFKELYRRRCRSCVGWYDVGEFALLGLNFVYEALENVRVTRDTLRTTQSQQKSYADNRKTDLEFDVGNWDYVIISNMKGGMRLGKKGKLIRHYVGLK